MLMGVFFIIWLLFYIGLTIYSYKIKNKYNMIYLKKFDDIASYEAYRNSEEFKRPNICYISNPKKVFFHPKHTLLVNEGAFYVSDGIFETTEEE